MLCRLLSLGFAVLLQACLPIPHSEQMSPAVVGTVLRNGAPAARLRLRVVARTTHHDCQTADAETRTDDSGRFAIPAVHQFFWLLVLLGDPYWKYRLCAFEGGAWEEIYTDEDIPRPPRITTDTLTCDLTRFHTDSSFVVPRRSACRGTARRSRTFSAP